MTGFRYRLYSPDWDEVGDFVTAVPNWSKGKEFMTGDGRRFRILGMIPAETEGTVFNAIWKVESVSR